MKKISLMLCIALLISVCTLTTIITYAQDNNYLSDNFETGYTAGSAMAPFSVSNGWSSFFATTGGNRGIDAYEDNGGIVAKLWGNKVSSTPFMTKTITNGKSYKIDYSIKSNGSNAFVSFPAVNQNETTYLAKYSATTVGWYNDLSLVNSNPNDSSTYQKYTIILNAIDNTKWTTSLYKSGLYLGSGTATAHPSTSINFKAKFISTAEGSCYYDNISIIEKVDSEFSVSIVDQNATAVDYIDVELSSMAGSSTKDKSLTTGNFTVRDENQVIKPIRTVEMLDTSGKRFRITFENPLSANKDYTLDLTNITDVFNRISDSSDILFTTKQLETNTLNAITGLNAATNASDVITIIDTYSQELGIDTTIFNVLSVSNKNLVANEIINLRNANGLYENILQVSNDFSIGMAVAEINTAQSAQSVVTLIETNKDLYKFELEYLNLYSGLDASFKTMAGAYLVNKEFNSLASFKNVFNNASLLSYISECKNWYAIVAKMQEKNDLFNIDYTEYNSLLAPALITDGFVGVVFTDFQDVKTKFDTAVSQRKVVEAITPPKSFNITNVLTSSNFDEKLLGNTLSNLDGWDSVVLRNISNNQPTNATNYANIKFGRVSGYYNVIDFDINTTSGTQAEPRLVKTLSISDGKVIIKFNAKFASDATNAYTTIGMDHTIGATAVAVDQLILMKMFKDYISNSDGIKYNTSTADWHEYIIIADLDNWTTQTYVDNQFAFESTIKRIKPTSADTFTLYLRTSVAAEHTGNLFIDNLLIGKTITGKEVQNLLKDNSGTEITAITNGKLTALKNITNNDGKVWNMNLYVATYNTDDMLLNVSVATDNLTPFVNKSISADVDVTSDTHYVKVFLWDNSLKSLVEIKRYDR